MEKEEKLPTFTVIARPVRKLVAAISGVLVPLDSHTGVSTGSE